MLNVTLAIHEAERRTAAVVGLPIERLPEVIPIAFQERTLSLWAISMGKQRTESASAAGLQAPESARNLSFHARAHRGTLPIYLAETLADVRFRDSGVRMPDDLGMGDGSLRGGARSLLGSPLIHRAFQRRL
jgi:hypothetical protein